MVCNARPADRRPEGAALETADDCAVDLDAPLDQREPVLEERGLRWGAPRRQRPRHGSAQGHQMHGEHPCGVGGLSRCSFGLAPNMNGRKSVRPFVEP
jgi:hypothetical protein